MTNARMSRFGLRAAAALTLAFIYVPLFVILLYAFNERRTQSWPIQGWTLDWFSKALDNPGVREALLTSLKAAAGATVIALVLEPSATIDVGEAVIALVRVEAFPATTV